MDKYQLFRRYISPFINGENADALLNSLADEVSRGQDLSIAVTDQLTISTASTPYLQKLLADIGINIPPEIGISDDASRQLGIAVNAQKLITNVIHDVLEIFYGPESVRAVAQSTIAEPYPLADQMDLSIVLEDGTEHTIVFNESEFDDIQNATAAEVAGAITSKLRALNVENSLALNFLDLNTNETYVRIFGAAKGPYSLVQVTGGAAQAILRFGNFRATNLPSNTTVWQVTKNSGQTIRYRWDGGPKPLLSEVEVGDKVLIYGGQFGATDASLPGTYVVTAVRVSKNAPAYDAGWFEITNDNETVLKFSQPDVAPPPNGGGNVYSYIISQGQYSDLMFFQATKNTSYSKPRYAVAFEPKRNLMKIYMPATTKVVERDLVGGAYLHMLYPPSDFDGNFGSINDPSQMIRILSPYAIQFPVDRLDNLGTGGTLTYGMTIVPIDNIFRENGFVTVITSMPHGLIGINQWETSTDYLVGATAFENGFTYTAIQASGPAHGGAREPVSSPLFWRKGNAALNLSNTVVTVAVDNVMSDDPNSSFPGPYIADLTEQFTLTTKVVKTRESIEAGENRRTLLVLGELPAESGVLLANLANDNEEYPIRYVTSQVQGAPGPNPIVSASQNGLNIVVNTLNGHGAVPEDTVTLAGTGSMDGSYTVKLVTSPNIMELTAVSPQVAYSTSGTVTLKSPGTVSTLILDPTYEFKNGHPIGSDLTLLSSATAFVPSPDGSDYSAYVTSDAEARVFAKDVINSIVALGIQLQIVVVYPDDAGLGNAGDSIDETVDPHSEATYVWGI